MISSLNNSRIKNVIQLQKKSKIRKEQKAFIVEGIKMFFEAPKEQILEAYVSESFYEEKQLEDLNYFKGYQIEVVSDSVFKEISDTQTPQGILAVVRQLEYRLEDVIKDENCNLVVLEDLRDPGNVGTILRTAEGAGVTGVILSKASVDIFNPKVIRSTMGSIYRIPFVYVEDILEAIECIKSEGITLYAAHLAGNKYYDEEDYTGKCGILIGNEANGLSKEISEKADRLIKIPMAGKVESLNAAIAAAILMYEVYSQKRK